VVVGNSSSGIIEAPSFRVPVVNIGTRQDGRPRAVNVVDVGNESASILAGLRRATSADFRGTLVDMENPYGDGRAAERIVDVLCGVALDDRLKRKGFVDWSES
jgi:UDP-N-acetylglucosamine 2-epimerase (non-hydrolysing)/GDP/UDP-N,N'-diacetylbacillosamine 2-epimerase (hydrolysing)